MEMRVGPDRTRVLVAIILTPAFLVVAYTQIYDLKQKMSVVLDEAKMTWGIFTICLLVICAFELMVYGKSCKYTKDGVEVSFMMFRRFYPWSSIQTRFLMAYGWTAHRGKVNYGGGMFFSTRKWKRPTRIGMSFYVYLHPISGFFVTFPPMDQNVGRTLKTPKSDFDPPNMVNDYAFLSMLKGWGIEFDQPEE